MEHLLVSFVTVQCEFGEGRLVIALYVFHVGVRIGYVDPIIIQFADKMQHICSEVMCYDHVLNM